jgi:hypothetical protein
MLSVTDGVSPHVVSIAPADGSVDVDPASRITVVFDEAIALPSLVGGFALSGPGGAVPGSIAAAADALSFVFTPNDASASAAGLAPGADYTLTLSEAVTDLAGNALAAAVSASFRVRSDVSGPCVVEVSPTRGELDASLTPAIEAVFDEPIDPASVLAGSGRLLDVGSEEVLAASAQPGPADDAGQVRSVRLELSPATLLHTEQILRVEWLREITDVFGNPARGAVECAGGPADPLGLVSYEHTFKTGRLLITAPANGARAVEGQTLEFSAQPSPGLGVISTDFRVQGELVATDSEAPFVNGITVPLVSELAVPPELTLDAVGRSEEGATAHAESVTLTVVAAGKDSDGDGLTNAEELGLGSDPFATDSDGDGLADGAEPNPTADADGDGLINILDPDSDGDGFLDGEDVTTGPKLLALLPADGSTGVSLDVQLEAGFDEPLDLATVGAASLALEDSLGTPVPGSQTLSTDDRGFLFRPSAALALGETYSLVFDPSGLADTDGNAVTDGNGSPLGIRRHAFTTAAFGLVAPADGAVAFPGSTLQLEAVAHSGLGVASVSFEVDGVEIARPLAAPYVTNYGVPSTGGVQPINVAAIAWDGDGVEIARATAVVTVAAQLQVASRLHGLAFGETRALRFFTAAPLSQDLAVEIRIANPSVASVPANAFSIPAGETDLFVPVTGGSAGESCVFPVSIAPADLGEAGCGTSLVASTTHSEVGVALFVGPAVVAGRSFEITASPVGVAVRSFPTLGQVVLAPSGSGVLSVGLLSTPASIATPVVVTSSDPSVAQVLGLVTIPAEGTDAVLDVSAFGSGEAILTLQAGDTGGSLRVVVGELSPDRTAPVVAPPVGVEVCAEPACIAAP